MLSDIEIRKIPLDLINPATYNPRVDLTPDTKEYKRLKKSLNEFGYADPLIWNETTGNLVSGHQRLKILKEKGLKEITVSVVHMNEPKEKAFNIALNKISGRWDDFKLKELFNEIENSIDIETIGFDTEEFNQIMKNESKDFDFIDELLQDNFVSLSTTKEYFDITFTFKTEFKDTLDKYLKENGKETLTEKIIEWVTGEF